MEAIFLCTSDEWLLRPGNQVGQEKAQSFLFPEMHRPCTNHRSEIVCEP